MSKNLDQAKQKVLEENTAQAVFKNLRRLENERDRFRTRWAWELLQNARDTARTSGVEVAFVSKEGRLIFKHTGRPFSEDNIVHLIYHGSSKVDESDPVGHFGTGFISTHLLSKTVHVCGTLEDEEKFNFILDRGGSTPIELQESMERSWGAFKESIQPENTDATSSFSTEYVYELDDDTKSEMVSEGLAEIRHNAGFILAFNEDLRAIHLEIDGNKILFQKTKAVESDIGCIYVSIEECDDSNSANAISDVAVATDGKVAAAVLLNKEGNSRCLSSLEKTPRLYVAFPLLGTEQFSLPCVINSIQFEPTEDRDGVFLASSDSEDNIQNRILLERGLKQAAALLSIAEDEGWDNSYMLAKINDIKSENWLDDEWYRKLLKSDFLTIVRQTEILPNINGGCISPLKAWIPVGEEGVTPTDIWNLISKLKEGKQRLPKESELDEWSTNLVGWSALMKIDPFDMDEVFGVEKLTQYVAELKTLEHLQDSLEEDIEATSWLNELYQLIFSSNRSDLFDGNPILLNQSRTFCIRGQLKIDKKSPRNSTDLIDGVLKDISEGFDNNVRDKLLDSRVDIKNFEELLPALTQDELVTDLVSLVREQRDKECLSEILLKSNVSLFVWLIKHQEWKNIEGYPVTTQGTKENLISWQALSHTNSKPDTRLLAPPALWPEVVREYSDLFPDHYIISDEYFDACQDVNIWKSLKEHDYVLCSPIFHAEQKIKDFLPDEPLQETDDEESRKSSEPVLVSKIAFLRTDDIGILNTIRGSKRKSVRFLEFLVYAVLENDQDALDKAQVVCENEETHTYYKAEWLVPLKRRKWLPIGERKQGQISHETLGLLVKDEPELMSTLTDGKPAQLVQALGVSLSALSLQALADDEDERVSLIKSLASISNAAGGDIDKIEELANDLKEDPGLLSKLEESREKRKQVAENQRVGALVEQLFEEMLEGKGFVVERTGIGSDYSIESDIFENGEEIGLSVKGNDKQYLVEIKATKGDAVRMSSKQMETAVLQNKRFVVCYVKLPNEEANMEIVEKQCRFILGIGDKVDDLWRELQTLCSAKNKCDSRAKKGDLTLEVDELGARLRIGNETWRSGKTLDDAIKYFTE